MDSLTQIALGAAVGEAVLGRKVGNKAVVWGAVCGTLPDLDVFVPFADPVRDFTFHRSFSHSLFVLALLTPLLVWLISRLHPSAQKHKSAWAWLVWLCFTTHVLLDCFTIYGTQIFWPIWNYPVGLGSIFIIDPLYTIPLLIGVLCALILTRTSSRGHLINNTALGLSTIYLAWSVAAQSYVTTAVEQSLSDQSVRYEKLLVSPAPLNTLLWRIVAMQSDGSYIEGYYSLADGEQKVTYKHYESRQDLLRPLAGQWTVERLRWFSKGFYKVWEKGEEVVLSDLRMGAEPNYVFSFVVGKTAPQPKVLAPRQIETERDLSMLKEIWQRIWTTSET